MSRRALTMLGAVAGSCCLLVATACTGEPGASPTPSPSSSAPTAVETPPETEQEREEQLAYKAAEKSYRKFIAERDRIGRAGGATRATPVMRETAFGPYLAFYVDLNTTQKQSNFRFTGRTKIGYVRFGGYSPEELVLDVCEDGSSNRVLDQGGDVIDRGQILRRALYVRPDKGTWKLYNGDEKGEAETCVE